MKRTNRLGLPIFDNPTTDKFGLDEWNYANETIDEAYDEIDNIMKEIPKVNASAEIIEARKGSKTLGEKIGDIDKVLENATSQLEQIGQQKANKTDVFTMANMGQDVKTAMTGGSVAVVGKNAILNENIVPNQITPDKIAQVYLPDLLVRETITYDKYTSNGIEYSNVGSAYSSFISVVPGDSYEVYFGDKTTGSLGAGVPGTYFDSSKVMTSNIEAFSEIIKVITIPSNVFFVKINLAMNKSDKWYFKPTKIQKSEINWLKVTEDNIDDNAIKEEKLSIELREKLNQTNSSAQYSELLYSKSPIYIGDSITAGIGSSDRYKYNYPTQLNTLLKMDSASYLNYGVSGTTVTTVKGDGTSFVERVESMPLNLNKDICFIKGGTNDFVLSSTLETLAIAKAYKQANGIWNKAEFYGAYCNMIELIKSKSIAKRIVLLTPITEKDQNISNAKNKLLINYVNAVLEIAKEYKLPVIDMFRTLGIDATNSEHKTLYVPDGIHPNDEGYKLMAERIARFMTNEYSVQLLEYMSV